MKIRTKFAALALAFTLSFGGACPPKGYIQAETVCAAEYTSAVSDLKSKAGTNSADISWKKLSSAKSYKVEIKKDGGKYEKADFKLSKTSSRVTAKIKNLSPDTKYTVKVTPVKESGGSAVRGKSKTVKFTTKAAKTNGFQGGSAEFPDKYDSSLELKGTDIYNGENVYVYKMNGDPSAADYTKKAEGFFKNYAAYLNKNGYFTEYMTEADNYKKDPTLGSWIHFYKDNVFMGALIMFCEESENALYVLYEVPPESIDMNQKSRVPHPDEYGIKCTPTGGNARMSNMTAFFVNIGKSSDYDLYLKKLKADGFELKTYSDSYGYDWTEVYFKGNMAGALNLSEINGFFSVMIIYG